MAVLRGRRVVDRDDRYVGTLEEVYLDDDGEPTRWAVVETGVGERSRSFVPLSDAEVAGEDLRIAHGRDQVLAAAEVEPDGELTAQEEQRLSQIYGLGGGELIRSEEELHVSTKVQASGRVRLRKVIVSEDVTVTVTLRREEVRLEPVPDTESADDTPAALDETGETLFEVTLHEEVPVIGTRVVPRERIRLRKVVVSEDRAVSAPVRAEQFELIDERPSAPPAPLRGEQDRR